MDRVPILFHEAFLSIQGEGPFMGRCTFFIRLAGCNLSCRWCDSKQERLPPPIPLDVRCLEIPSRCNTVCLTGGEPLLHPLDEICRQIREIYPHITTVTAETNGSKIPSPEQRRGVNSWVVSPKLKGSQIVNKGDPLANIDWWSKTSAAFKFVVEGPSDFIRVLELVRIHSIYRSKVWIMKQGTAAKDFVGDVETVELCNSAGFNYSSRLHVLTWGGKGGV